MSLLRNFNQYSIERRIPLAAISDTYEKHAIVFPDKIAIQTRNQTINYSDWYKLIKQTATWLNSLNVANKTVEIYLPNGIPFLQLFTGAAAAGWTAVLFDTKWKEAEIKERLSVAFPSIFITTRKLAGKVGPFVPTIIIWEECAEFINQAEYHRSPEIDGHLPFYMGFTSGTTGAPKAFIRSHDSWLASFDCNRNNFQMDETENVLIPGGLVHSHFLYGTISTLYLGGTVFLLEKFSAELALEIINEQPISTVFVVPTMVQAFLKIDGTINKPIKMISSGAKWEVNSKQKIQTKFLNLIMYEFYGASELSFVTFLSHQENHLKPGSVGKPCWNVELQIRNRDNKLAAPNEIGKIFVRSTMVFMGYLNTNTRTVRTIHDQAGWITVDDMGYLDEDGYLYIADRENNMILYGGINVFPEEIEKVLSSHPAVEEVAVIGLPNPYWGQIITAVVTGTVNKVDLIRLCKETLSSFKIPRRWYFLNEMPYTTSGKIARAKLKEELESKVICHS